MSRLTDEQIEGMALWAQEDFNDGRMHACAMLLVPMAAIELQERRSSDLTAADLDSLKWLRGDVEKRLNPVADDGCPCSGCNQHRRALVALDRLLSQKAGG